MSRSSPVRCRRYRPTRPPWRRGRPPTQRPARRAECACASCGVDPSRSRRPWPRGNRGWARPWEAAPAWRRPPFPRGQAAWEAAGSAAGCSSRRAENGAGYSTPPAENDGGCSSPSLWAGSCGGCWRRQAANALDCSTSPWAEMRAARGGCSAWSFGHPGRSRFRGSCFLASRTASRTAPQSQELLNSK